MTHDVDRILAGDLRAAARLIRDIDDAVPGAVEALKRLYPRTGRARIIGITGAPGSGKSTICDQLIRSYRGSGRRVGVVAVDPSSPFSGGAILGDRIRMQEHATDPGVFIRSMATRGNLGGLSASTTDVVRVMDAMGMDTVIIETVGVGQDEVEVARAAHATVVVLVPGMGDDIQAIKAGLLEVADCFVVNKADREGADKVMRELSIMLDMRARREGEWAPPIVRMAALHGEGTQDLRDALDRHDAFFSRDDRAESIRCARRRSELVEILRAKIGAEVMRRVGERPGGLDGLVQEMQASCLDPYTVAEDLLRGSLGNLGK